MTFHKEGYTALALCILLIFIVNATIQFYMPQANGFHWLVYILSFVLFVVVIWFFRSPSVDIQTNEKTVLSPADGTIVAIEEVEETEYLQDKRILISVAISPFDAHVNRNPIGGAVKYLKYHPAKSLFTSSSKTSTDVEHNTIAIESATGTTVLLKQLGGAVSHFIVRYLNEGDTAEQGQQFGFVKFGSRMDVFLPLGSEVQVDVGDGVKGGVTVLAELMG